MKFGAFIITYNRPDILRQSIQTLLHQTCAPDQILLVDNSEQKTAMKIYEEVSALPVTYHSMGYNAGPAGAAHFGLAWFKARGYDWAHWADDDNPPELNTTFERLFMMIHNYNGQIGIAGAVGQRFNFYTGRIVRLKDEALTRYLEVDVMAGGSYMVINLDAVSEKTLPESRLFFGFEEFDFCLKIKQAGYQLIVDGDLMRDYRVMYGRFNRTVKMKRRSDTNALLRQYYSTRNLIYIFLKLSSGHKQIVLYRILIAMGKIIYGFTFGWRKGYQNVRYQTSAIVDGLSGTLGKKEFDN